MMYGDSCDFLIMVGFAFLHGVLAGWDCQKTWYCIAWKKDMFRKCLKGVSSATGLYVCEGVEGRWVSHLRDIR